MFFIGWFLLSLSFFFIVYPMAGYWFCSDHRRFLHKFRDGKCSYCGMVKIGFKSCK